MSVLGLGGVILAGGKSERMGRDKAFVEFNGQPLIKHVIERVGRVCSELVIVANDTEAYTPFGPSVVPDIFPGRGPLGGIYSGLEVVSEPYALVVACDMPFLQHELLRFLASLAPGFDIVIPHAVSASEKTTHSQRQAPVGPANRPTAKEQDLHPMHAIYSRYCLDPIRARLQDGDWRTISFHSDVKVRIVGSEEIDRYDPRHLSFFNINTPRDLQVAEALSSGS